MELRFHEALILFVFWAVQFFVPSSRQLMIGVYLLWCAVELVLMFFLRDRRAAWRGLRGTLGRRFA
jgi:hypothetical protein